MPTPTKYTYSITADVILGSVDVGRLTQDIQSSPIVTALDYIVSSGDVLDVWFKDALSAGDKTLLDGDTTGPCGGMVGAHSGVPIAEPPTTVTLTNQVTSDNRLKVAIEKSEGSRLTYVTHDWTDKTTWYQESVRVVDEVASDSGDHTTYTVTHTYMIDMYHGKQFDEDNLLDGSGNSYRVVVKVDDVVKTEQDPHPSSGGDFTINYVTGSVTFLTPLAGTEVVKVTYHYQNGSKFKLTPTSGKKISTESVDVQFSSDIALLDTAIFEMMGLIDVFAPQLVSATPDYVTSFPSGMLIPLATTRYKGMRDFQNECDRSYPAYPAMGGAGWRGLQQSTQVYHWEYVRSVEIKSSWGMELHIYLEHDVAFSGEYATATLYCVSLTE